MIKQRTSSTSPSPAPDLAKRRGVNWLVLARWVWIAVVLGLLANLAASIPFYYMTLRTVCTHLGHCAFWQPTPANLVALARLHLPVEAYAAYMIALDTAVSLLFCMIGLLIFWRKSNTWMGLFFSLVLVMYGSNGMSATLSGAFLTPDSPLILGIAIALFSFLQWPALGAFLVVFPTGRFAPRWSWVIVVLWIVQFVYFLLSTVVPVLQNFLFPVVFTTYGSTLGVQIYRYVRIYDAVQRQQVKWFLFAFFTGLAVTIIGNGVLGGLVAPLNAPDSWFQLLNGTLTACLFVPIPLAIGVAIFRYHLWDIDIIINRTLVYGLLTATLLVVYLVLVFGGQYLLASFFGPNNAVMLVISTLIVVALFQPLRQRMQDLVDRRFYRSKYDAAKVVAAFSSTLRNDVDLATLSEHLVEVVQETMQPTQVSLWLVQREARQVEGDAS